MMTYIPNQQIIINSIARNTPAIGEKYFALAIVEQDRPYCIIQRSTGAIIGSYLTPFFALSAYQDINRLYRYNDRIEPCDKKSFNVIDRIISQGKQTEGKELALAKYWVI